MSTAAPASGGVRAISDILADCQRRSADARERILSGDWKGGYSISVGIVDELLSYSLIDHPDLKLPLIQSLINLGVVFRVGNKLTEAEARLAIAFRMMVGAAVDEEVAPVTATPETAMKLAASLVVDDVDNEKSLTAAMIAAAQLHSELGILASQQEKWDHAELWLDAAALWFILLTTRTTRTADTDFLGHAVSSLLFSSGASLQQGQPDAAAESYRQAIALISNEQSQRDEKPAAIMTDADKAEAAEGRPPVHQQLLLSLQARLAILLLSPEDELVGKTGGHWIESAEARRMEGLGYAFSVLPVLAAEDVNVSGDNPQIFQQLMGVLKRIRLTTEELNACPLDEDTKVLLYCK